jgi:nicotinamidase-related amidase
MARLNRSEALLVVIDVQERLMPVIHEAAELERNVERLVRGCHVFDVPTVLTEQYVKGLGPTTPRIRQALEESGGYTPVEKSCFSAHGSGEFQVALRGLRRRQILVAGVEAHVCVYQTVIDLLAQGDEVTVIADAVSSRVPYNKEMALRRMQSEGAKLSTTEMALFEMLGAAGSEEFRAISRLVK